MAPFAAEQDLNKTKVVDYTKVNYDDGKASVGSALAFTFDASLNKWGYKNANGEFEDIKSGASAVQGSGAASYGPPPTNGYNNRRAEDTLKNGYASMPLKVDPRFDSNPIPVNQYYGKVATPPDVCFLYDY